MKRPARVEFLERHSYRQRRARDAARLLPVFAAILMLFPLMWPRQTPDQSMTTSGMLYLFGLWAVLVVCGLVLSRVLEVATQDAPPTAQRTEADE